MTTISHSEHEWAYGWWRGGELEDTYNDYGETGVRSDLTNSAYQLVCGSFEEGWFVLAPVNVDGGAYNALYFCWKKKEVT